MCRTSALIIHQWLSTPIMYNVTLTRLVVHTTWCCCNVDVFYTCLCAWGCESVVRIHKKHSQEPWNNHAFIHRRNLHALMGNMHSYTGNTYARSQRQHLSAFTPKKIHLCTRNIYTGFIHQTFLCAFTEIPTFIHPKNLKKFLDKKYLYANPHTRLHAKRTHALTCLQQPDIAHILTFPCSFAQRACTSGHLPATHIVWTASSLDGS